MTAFSIRSTTVTLLMLCIGVAIVGAAALTVEVRAPRELRLALVDARKPSVEREAMSRGFAAGIGSALSRRDGGSVAVRLKPVKASLAKVAFNAGDCDAVLVIGDDRPAALRGLDAVALCGLLDAGEGLQGVYLIVGSENPAMRESLTLAFLQVLTDRRWSISPARSKLAMGDRSAAVATVP